MAAAMAWRSPGPELMIRPRRRRAPSTTHASTMSVVAEQAAGAPAARARMSSRVSVSQPGGSRDSRAWRLPPRQAWARTGAVARGR